LAVNGRVDYAYDKISAENLKGIDVLFNHIPKKKYTPEEIQNIHDFINAGGSLLLVMDSDDWSSLEEKNVNEIISPFGIKFKGHTPDSLAGGHTIKSAINSKPLKISYHEARIVEGGTPFCFGDQLGKAYPFG